jgi:hypothetical protein
MYVRYLRQKYRSGGWLVSHHFLRYWPEQISAARWNPNIVVRSIISYLYKSGTYKESNVARGIRIPKVYKAQRYLPSFDCPEISTST